MDVKVLILLHQGLVTLIRMDVIHPFCVGHHVIVHLNALVFFIKTNAKKKKKKITKTTHGHMVTENEFSCRNFKNWKFSIIKPMTIETCLLPFLRQLHIFGHYLCGNQIISITKLCWVIKTITCIPIHFFFGSAWVLCCLTSNDCHIHWKGRVKPLWVFEVLNCPILHLQLVLNFIL